MLLHELVKGLLADAGHDLAQQKIVDVAVDEPPARRLREHFFSRQPDGFL
jgi:hypothetical protein